MRWSDRDGREKGAGFGRIACVVKEGGGLGESSLHNASV